MSLLSIRFVGEANAIDRSTGRSQADGQQSMHRFDGGGFERVKWPRMCKQVLGNAAGRRVRNALGAVGVVVSV